MASSHRYASYQLDTPLHRIYSEASIGKAHLRQMGLQPWRNVQTDVPNSLLATIMETYYGGRTECHIRRVAMPGVLTDVRSEYPTVFVLQRLWPFLTAQRIQWTDEPPDVVRKQLRALTLDRLLDATFWPELTRLVLVEPDGDPLPTRTDYAGRGVYNLAISRRVGGPAQWFTYADVLASWLTTGRTPRVLRVLHFQPGPAQPGLRPIHLAGRPDFRIDPYTDDLIQRSTELREDLRAEQRQAKTDGKPELATAPTPNSKARRSSRTPSPTARPSRSTAPSTAGHSPSSFTCPTAARTAPAAGAPRNPAGSSTR